MVFFFQAEDGIRDVAVTGVQTCALPISIFRLADHTERLFNSAHIYMMKIPYGRETLIEAQKEVVRANQHESCYIRPIAFYGSEKMGVSPIGATVHVAIAAWPWGAYLGAEALEKGIRVKTSSYARHHINVTMARSEEHTSELQSRLHLVCRLLLEKKKKTPQEPTQLRSTIRDSVSATSLHDDCVHQCI